jgi:hypothetical protein
LLGADAVPGAVSCTESVRTGLILAARAVDGCGCSTWGDIRNISKHIGKKSQKYQKDFTNAGGLQCSIKCDDSFVLIHGVDGRDKFFLV